jgi:predicted ABC-type ATPase
MTNLIEIPNHADELLVYDNTAHNRGFRAVAHFEAGELIKTAQTMPDWVVKVFGKKLNPAKQPSRQPAR